MQTLRCSKVRTPPAHHKHRQDWLQYTVPLASAQCKNNKLPHVIQYLSNNWKVKTHVKPQLKCICQNTNAEKAKTEFKIIGVNIIYNS